jgi:hypothetical protein
MDIRRPSVDTPVDGSRKASGISVASNESVSESKGNAVDIMKDLEKLQQELDAYRAGVEGGGPPGGASRN